MNNDDKPALQVVGDETANQAESSTRDSYDQGGDAQPFQTQTGAQEHTDALGGSTPKSSGHAGLGRRGVFLLPNLITTGSLFAGFYAIVTAMNGQPLTACIAIFIAMMLDGADGRIARMTGTQSAFGAQYDSLSDLVAFGVAPALVAFSWGLSALGQIGWVAAFAYMACAALRLARFNVDGDEGSFTGLASPAAAGLIVFGIWVALQQGMSEPPLLMALLFAALTVSAALLMVSNYTYFSPKKINLRERIPFVTLVLIAMGFAVAMVDPPMVMFGMALVYAASGPLEDVWARLKTAKSARKPQDVDS